MTKDELSALLYKNSESILDFINQHQDEELKSVKDEKWSSYQHLDHLLRSIFPLNKAMKIPLPGIKILFGKPNRKERTYEETKAKYKKKLEEGAKASGRYIPSDKELNTNLIKKYKEQSEQLILTIQKWKEEDLSKYLLPHPILGKLTVREMLYFTAFHTEHHLQLMKSS
jgi:hypothetical protein